MKRAFTFFVFFLIAGCMQPLYESDYPVYRQYKYWESADRDWQEVDRFRIQIYRTETGSRTALRLVPQRDGLPSTAATSARYAARASS